MKKLAQNIQPRKISLPLYFSLHLLLKNHVFLFGRAGASLLPWRSLLGGAGATLAAVRGPLTAGASLSQSTDSRVCGLQELVGAVVAAPTSSVALQHAAYSQVRDRTRVSYTGRWILSTGPPGKSSLHLIQPMRE